MQPEFLAETLRLCKEAGIHTCLDTRRGFGGGTSGTLRGILENTSLVLFDVKDYDPARYRELTGQPIDCSERFIGLVQQMGVPVWVRQVVRPGVNDTESYLEGLRAYAGRMQGVERVELLPYHILGAHKYEAMGIPYPLAGMPPMDPEKCRALQEKYFPAST